MIKKIKENLIIALIIAVALGIIVGLFANEGLISIVMAIKHVLGQLIFFCVPLIIIGFITPAITGLQEEASKMLRNVLIIAYVSSVGAALFSMTAGYILIPKLKIVSQVEGLKELPEAFVELNIPPMMGVMTALVFSIIIGLAIIWTKSQRIKEIFDEFNNIILSVVNRIVIPVLPIFIASTFAGLSYEGSITKQFPVFIKVIFIVIVGHFIWMALLYLIAGMISGENPAEVFKHYGPAYLTAVGTMSSAATLPVALDCARKSTVLDPDVVDFTIPICSTIHLCGSVLTEVFFLMTVSQILYGELPGLATMIIFAFMLGIFAIGAPGVPGGTVMASLGLITSILGFDDAGVALIMTIFALQDSFGTACNIVGDGAIALMLTGIHRGDRKA